MQYRRHLISKNKRSKSRYSYIVRNQPNIIQETLICQYPPLSEIICYIFDAYAYLLTLLLYVTKAYCKYCILDPNNLESTNRDTPNPNSKILPEKSPF